MTYPAGLHPANMTRRVLDLIGETRLSGDRVAYEDAYTSLADLRIYGAAYLGIPERYIDPSSGVQRVPEDACRVCWQIIDGPLYALGAAGSCLHYHPDCRPDGRALDVVYPAGTPHPRPSCRSRLAHYAG